MGSHICVAPGSINIDLILKTDTLKGPKSFKGVYTESQGGKGLNQAAAARLAGGPEAEVVLVGCVGRDGRGDQALAELRARGVNADLTTVTDAAPTGVVLGYLYGDGEVTIGLGLGANSQLAVADIDRAGEVIRGARVLMSQIESPIEVVEHSIRMAKANGAITFLDPSVVPQEGEDRERLFHEILPHVDILAPNRSEALALTGMSVADTSDAMAAAEILLEHVGVALITMGPNGALVHRGRDYHVVPGLPVNAIDATAAGDTFRGAFCAALAKVSAPLEPGVGGIPFEDLGAAAEFANAAAALGVTRSGACPSIPTRAEIEEFRRTTKQ